MRTATKCRYRTALELDRREMLAAAVGYLSVASSTSPQVAFSRTFGDCFFGTDGHSILFASTSSKSGTIVGAFEVANITELQQQTLSASLSGANAGAFSITRIPETAGFAYFIRVASPRIVTSGKVFELTLAISDSTGVLTTRNVTFVTARTQSIMIDESPVAGQLIGRLPPSLSKARMQHKVLATSNWLDSYENPVEVGSGGELRAREAYTGPVQLPDDFQGFFRASTLFNYETASVPLPIRKAPLHSGDVLIEVYDSRQKSTQYVVLSVHVRNIDETPTIADQSLFVTLNGEEGRITFKDPDARASETPLADELNFSGPHQLKIIEGNDAGIFDVSDQVARYPRSTFLLKVVKPELLPDQTLYELRVQLLEKGKPVGEATVIVRVLS